MSGNARGQLKEEMEGIHRNLEWVRIHSAKGQDLATDAHPEIVAMFEALKQEMGTLDEILMRLYATI
jgi:hypothetical protein